MAENYIKKVAFPKSQKLIEIIRVVQFCVRTITYYNYKELSLFMLIYLNL